MNLTLLWKNEIQRSANSVHLASMYTVRGIEDDYEPGKFSLFLFFPYLQESDELQHPGPPLRGADAHLLAGLNLHLGD